jgi:hypothetical protein
MIETPRAGEENVWPRVYTYSGEIYQYLKEGYFIRIDSSEDWEYSRDINGKFVRKK